MLLENEQFLSELTKLFQKSRTHDGGISMTMKRYDGRTKPIPRNVDRQHPPQQPHQEYKCLFRAVMGNKKISTVVNAKDVNKFQLAYANVFKLSMDNLKKRDRKAEKERKEKKERKETTGVSTVTTATTSTPTKEKFEEIEQRNRATKSGVKSGEH